ncbi:cytoplasmic protein [Paenibacillus sp. FSL R5-0490]|uniref:DUF6434 domain-containing protein n=1 Tax=Bacillales TaxID=1385 RepID=UPI00096C67D1|nr:DUF6434 domain-containing protein [Paenibacillus sp. FSL R5-0490]OMF56801.1 cytoplasmic protein [Paenibacillus sp. FSL R5-0490]
MRPELKRDLDVQAFHSFYWLKKELQNFCRENGMSAAGSKMEITDRIAAFLQTGEIKKPVKKKSLLAKEVKLLELTLDTVITENHRCSQNVRVFFKSVIPRFHFSTYIQNYFKENTGKTYRDVVHAWHEEEERKKDPSYTKQIGSQFEYNQFIRDYFADPKNKGNNRENAIKAWNELKKQPGSNRYRG